MTVDYTGNPSYRADGRTTPKVTRCVCGHVMEWHYLLIHSTAHNGYVPGYRHHNANRCPSHTCDCTKPEWDGNPPVKLPDVSATLRSRSAPAA